MTRRHYRFLYRELRFRQLPRWQTLRLGRLFLFALGAAVGAIGGAFLLFRWYPSPTIRNADAQRAAEKERLVRLTLHLDTLRQLNAAVESLEKRLYHQLVPAGGLDTLTDTLSSFVASGGTLSEDSLTAYVMRVEGMLQWLLRTEALLHSHELRSPYLPRQLPCDCPEMGAGLGELHHPLTGQLQKHEGIDFLASEGKLVWATADGFVQSVERLSDGASRVTLRHTPTLTTVYFPLSPQVQIGQWVSAGTLLGTVVPLPFGRMGFLHYEVRIEGKAVDPMLFLWGRFTPAEQQYWKQALSLQTDGIH